MALLRRRCSGVISVIAGAAVAAFCTWTVMTATHSDRARLFDRGCDPGSVGQAVQY